jgi:uncharacterized NAD(P)/FAD-binding protein YdhS
MQTLTVFRAKRWLGILGRFRALRVTSSGACTVAIVGGGFSGTAVAVQLLRSSHAYPLRVILIDPARVVGGIAYSAQRYPFLLNVPASRMSANPADPLEFLRFAQRRIPGAAAHDFLPRELYGRYLESLLMRAAAASAPQVTFVRVRAEVIGLERDYKSTHVLKLDDGRSITADSVVLALGNPAAAPLPGDDSLPGKQHASNPWKTRRLCKRNETVLIAGTGLTMADIALAMFGSNSGNLTVHAISRHGLLPMVQSDFGYPSEDRFCVKLLDAGSVSLHSLLRTVRSLADDLGKAGGDWREVLAAARLVAPSLWRGLSPADQQRFLRHVRPYWEIHRHRLPEKTFRELEALQRRGMLHVHAGRIMDMQPRGKRIQIDWRARGRCEISQLTVDRVINCTGPDYNVQRTRTPLLHSLLARGMAVPDPLGLGLVTTELGALIDLNAKAARNLYYIGPMLRPKYWETTAVPELRAHAERLSQHLLSRMNIRLSSAGNDDPQPRL